MRKLVLIAALFFTVGASAQVINDGGSFVAVGGGGSGGAVALIKQTTGYEGSTFTVVGKSTLDFSHRLAVQYRYVAGAYALHVGQSNVALTYTDYFADAGTSHNESKLIATPGLYDGDSLYVRVVVAALDSSVVLDTLERGYLIDHDIVTLAMGNPYGGVDIFNPTGLVITDSVEVDATTFKTAWMRNSGGAWDDTCLVQNAKSAQVMSLFPVYGGDYTHLRIPLLWWKFEDYLPDNVTITDAYINLRSFEIDREIAFAVGDGVYAVLDTLSADVPWTEGSVNHCNNGKDPLQTSAQISFMSRASQAPWDTAIEMRPATFWWGPSSAMCREFGSGDNVLNANQDIKIDVKDLLQYWVDYHDVRDLRQAGFFITARRAASGTNYDWAFQCGTNGTYEEYSPSLIVRYQRKPFTDYPYNDSPNVFVFTDDDGHKDALKYADVMEKRNKRMTIFAVRDNYGTIPLAATYMDSVEYNALFDAGHEVGVQANDNIKMSVVSEDSLGHYIGRSYWAQILGLSGADTMQLATFAYNIGDTSSAGIAKLKEYGYIGSRLAGAIAERDTVGGGTLPWAGPANLMKANKWKWSDLADHDDNADSVRVKVTRAIGKSSARGTPVRPRPIITLSHGTSMSTYSEMDTLGLGLIIDELIRRKDVDINTFKNVLTTYRDKHVPDNEGGIIWRLP